MQQLEAHDIHYELSAGTGLGAVKLGATMPWDLDHDVQILSNNISNTAAFKVVVENLKQKGYR